MSAIGLYLKLVTHDRHKYLVPRSCHLGTRHTRNALVEKDEKSQHYLRGEIHVTSIRLQISSNIIKLHIIHTTMEKIP